MNNKEIIKDIVKEAEGRESIIGQQSRRVWLQNLGLITASATVLWACGDSDDKAIAYRRFDGSAD